MSADTTVPVCDVCGSDAKTTRCNWGRYCVKCGPRGLFNHLGYVPDEVLKVTYQYESSRHDGYCSDGGVTSVSKIKTFKYPIINPYKRELKFFPDGRVKGYSGFSDYDPDDPDFEIDGGDVNWRIHSFSIPSTNSCCDNCRLQSEYTILSAKVIKGNVTEAMISRFLNDVPFFCY